MSLQVLFLCDKRASIGALFTGKHYQTFCLCVCRKNKNNARLCNSKDATVKVEMMPFGRFVPARTVTTHVFSACCGYQIMPKVIPLAKI